MQITPASKKFLKMLNSGRPIRVNPSRDRGCFLRRTCIKVNHVTFKNCLNKGLIEATRPYGAVYRVTELGKSLI